MEKIFNKKLAINSDLLQWFVIIGIFLNQYCELFVILIVSIILIKRYHFLLNKKILIGGLIIVCHACLMLVLLSYDYSKTLQQICVVSSFVILYYQFFSFVDKKKNIRDLFAKYLKFIVVVAYLGVVQFVIYFLFQKDIFAMFLFPGITTPQVIQGNIIRIHSIMAEPSSLGTMLIPFFSSWIFFPDVLRNIGIRDKIVVFGVAIMTYSTILFFIVALLLFVKILSFVSIKYRIIGLFVCVAFFLYPTITVEREYSQNTSGFNSVIMKLDQTFNNTLDDPAAFDALNLSSYALITNLWVSTHAPSRLFGTGLGTHELNYKKTYQSDSPFYGINSEEGYSLFNRIFSEFGYVGISLYIIFLLKNLNTKSPINISAFVLIMALLLRGGHYVIYGCVFFHFLLVYTSIHKYSKDGTDPSYNYSK